MDRHEIPTAKWKAFTRADEAKKFVRELVKLLFQFLRISIIFVNFYFKFLILRYYRSTFPALVVKAAGLAAGKGVVVAKDKNEACQAIDEILTEKKFGNAGEIVVVEELLEGEEVSLLFFTDGKENFYQ